MLRQIKKIRETLPHSADLERLVAMLTEPDPDADPDSEAAAMAADEARRFSRPLSGLGALPRREGASTKTAEAEFAKMFPNAQPLRS